MNNNFTKLDLTVAHLQSSVNTINTNLDSLNLATSNGARRISVGPGNSTVNQTIFEKLASYDGNNVLLYTFAGNTNFESIKPPHSCKLMVLMCNGNTTISGSIDTYPKSITTEIPPNTADTNKFTGQFQAPAFPEPFELGYVANGNNSQLTMVYSDYINFINNSWTTSKITYNLSIPAATAAGGVAQGSEQNVSTPGTAGTATNTCNGGGSGGVRMQYCGSCYGKDGAIGCIFGQYPGGIQDNAGVGYGTGNGATAYNKYRCGLVIIVSGNLTLSANILQIGGNSTGPQGPSGVGGTGGYGGGGGGYRGSSTSQGGGGGGAPVFIYYSGTYTNNGTINTSGGYAGTANYPLGYGGAGGIKVTKISL